MALCMHTSVYVRAYCPVCSRERDDVQRRKKRISLRFISSPLPGSRVPGPSLLRDCLSSFCHGSKDCVRANDQFTCARRVMEGVASEREM